KDILESGSKEDLEKATGELSEVAQKVGAAAYQEQSKTSQEQDKQDEQEAPQGNGQKKEEKKVEEGEVVS
ncbi:hypothetical protein HY032_01330, partial [Candidatus Gottesmanbacteria bacterium]|nr:hypothetical protein [Candidatus Gottesmanbacteria bacterium]